MNTGLPEDHDWEKRFYDIMSTIPAAEYEGMRERLASDLIDVTNGHQVGIDSEDCPYILLRLAGPKSAVAFVHAVEGVEDHGCPDGLISLLLLMKIASHYMQRDLLPLLDPAIRDMPDPFHEEGHS